jgi:hypothetical protein
MELSMSLSTGDKTNASIARYTRMIRDTAIAALLQQRLSATDSLKRDAASVLIDLCRDGMSDTEIAAALKNAGSQIDLDLAREIHAAAGRSGISLPEPGDPR